MELIAPSRLGGSLGWVRAATPDLRLSRSCREDSTFESFCLLGFCDSVSLGVNTLGCKVSGCG